MSSLLVLEGLPNHVREELFKAKDIAVKASNLYRPFASSIVTNPLIDDVAKSLLLFEWGSVGEAVTVEGCFDVLQNAAKTEIGEWSFNVFEHSEAELLGIAKHIFVHLGILSTVSVTEDVLEHFLVAVKELYKDNPYHNWRHAVDVLQATFWFITHCCDNFYLTSLELLSLLVSALCHDVGHPGVSNGFMVASASDLALAYNDQSVLENFHCTTTFRLILNDPTCNLLSSLSPHQFAEVRKSIIACILATDPASHFEVASKLAMVVADSRSWDPACSDQRVLFMKCIIKMADISNVARMWDRGAFEWATRINTEMFAQGDREKKMGLDVAAFLDRDQTTVAKNSLNFIDLLSAPFFYSLGQLHRAFADEVVATLSKNRIIWEARL
jgi:hypothetical protein